MILMHQEIRVTPKKERQDDSETSVKEIGIENCLQPFLFREKLTPNKILSLFLSLFLEVLLLGISLSRRVTGHLKQEGLHPQILMIGISSISSCNQNDYT